MLRVWWLKLICIVLLHANIQNAFAATLVKNGANGKLIDLNEDNWQSMLNGEWMIEFFAPWCPACKNLAPTWEKFALSASDINVQVAKIDVTTSPSLSGRFFVTALPTIYHVKDGEFRQYRGSRDSDALWSFVKKQQWQKVEPISAWKKPDTIHMSVLSYFFKLSHTLKDFNARLQDEYGLPTWGSYALFAVATIFVGAAMGLMLVCIVDFIYPPKKLARQSFSDVQDNIGEGIDDLAAEDIEDEMENIDNYEDDDADDADACDDEDDNDEAEAEAEVEEIETSEGEKNSHSESEEPECEHIGDTEKLLKDKALDDDEKEDKETSGATIKTTDVRKRKPRKAD